jgi:N-acetylglucosaminyl-diphospho-decaprenol L-rhamnosyltransferase
VADVDIDVGVVTWNTAEVTPGALRRLIDRSSGMRLRVMVRDNGSTDGTVEAIRATVPEAEIDADENNLGFAAGLNRLVARGTASWFLALNPDAWPDPGALGPLLRAGESMTTAAAVAPRLERPDGTLEHSTHPFPSLRVELIHALGARHWLAPRQLEREMLETFWNHDESRRVDWAVGAVLLMRRCALEEIGPWDEGYFMYAEDIDWCRRAFDAGWDLLFEPDSVFRHVGNASGAKAFGPGRVEREAAALLRYYRKFHGPAATRLYRAVSAVACAEQWLGARLRSDHGAAEHWSREARAMVRGPRIAGPGAALTVSGSTEVGGPCSDPAPTGEA